MKQPHTLSSHSGQPHNQSLSISVSFPTHGKKKARLHNSVYVAIASEVVNRRSVHLINFVLNGKASASNPLLHIHTERCAQLNWIMRILTLSTIVLVLTCCTTNKSESGKNLAVKVDSTNETVTNTDSVEICVNSEYLETVNENISICDC